MSFAMTGKDMPIRSYDVHRMLDSIPCYISIQDSGLRILYTNQAFKNDFGDGEGKLCHRVYKSVSFRCEDCPVLKTFDDGLEHFSEETVQLLSGEICQVFVQSSAMKDQQGNVEAVIELLTNITALKKTRKELSVLGQSIAFLSHAIKNILEGLQGGAYVVDEGIKDNDMVLAGKGWNIVKKNIFDITDVAQNILFSSKDRPLNYQHAHPNKLAEDTINLFKDRSLSLDIRLIFEPEKTLPFVLVDAASIKRMLNNLIWNAMEACMNDLSVKSHSVIVRTGFYDDGHFMFEVEDNGMGMDENTKKNIFEEFFSTKGSKGTGLGLSVVDKIVNKHGGRIEIDSSTGQGALFRIIFKLRDDS